MPNPTFLGYLTNPYLQDPYSGDTGLYSWGMEVNRIIVNNPNPIGMEVLRSINSKENLGMEATLVIKKNDPYGMEVQRTINSLSFQGMEVQRNIVDLLNYSGMEANLTILDQMDIGMEVILITSVDSPVGMEVSLTLGSTKTRGMETTLVIKDTYPIGLEVQRAIKDLPDSLGMEVLRNIVDVTKTFGMEIRLDHSMASWICEESGYLVDTYLESPYLSQYICAQMGYEVSRKLYKDLASGMEVLRVIESQKTFGSEVTLVIGDYPDPIGMEVNMFRAYSNGMQTRLVLYNTTNLRIMLDFPSRGTSGLNWTSTSTETGDFNPNHLNTDIVEQVWRSETGTTSVILTSDTEIPQGTAIDTIAILNHNLTTSATITIEGSNSPVFSPVGETILMEVTTGDAYYIAPSFPNQQYRYWRFLINDPTNTNNYLQIGTIIFGTTIIFQGECFVDEVTRKLMHFSDKVPTEGFTNVSNDRALKRAVSLEFRSIYYRKGNYKNIRNIFETARTSLKALWIPDPQQVTRFTIFGKLVTLPDEVHRNYGEVESDLVDFTIEIDESL